MLSEADDLPWNRNLDFKKAKANANWDDSMYDPNALAAMEAIRNQNARVLVQLEAKLAEQSRKDNSISVTS